MDRLLDRVCLAREDPLALGVLRIALVALLLASLLAHTGAVADYFSAASMVSGEAARSAFPTRFSLFFYVTSPWAVRSLFALGVVAHVLWLVGWHTRVASLAAWLLWISMYGRNPLLYSMADELQMALCTWLAVVPAGRGLSLDARYGRGGPVPVWCRRLFQLQLAVLYTSTGLFKTGKTWNENGTALYYALSNPYNRHFDLTTWFAWLQPWVLGPLTFAVLVFEVSFAAFVAVHWLRGLCGYPRRFPDLRWLYLPFGVAMHAGIQATLYVAWFSPLSVATYLSFFRSEELRRAWARLSAAVRRQHKWREPRGVPPFA